MDKLRPGHTEDHDLPSGIAGPGSGGSPADAMTLDAIEDLGDMLTVIMGSLEQLAGQPLTPRGRHQLARADAAANRAGRIVHRALRSGA